MFILNKISLGKDLTHGWWSKLENIGAGRRAIPSIKEIPVQRVHGLPFTEQKELSLYKLSWNFRAFYPSWEKYYIKYYRNIFCVPFCCLFLRQGNPVLLPQLPQCSGYRCVPSLHLAFLWFWRLSITCYTSVQPKSYIL